MLSITPIRPVWHIASFGGNGRMDVPAALTLDPAPIPRYLTELRRWVAWDWFRDGSYWRKVPIDPRFGLYSDNLDVESDSSIDEAVAFAHRYELPGVGIIIPEDEDIFVLDFDNCIDPATKRASYELEHLISEIGSYTEVSPSGTGIHIAGYSSLAKKVGTQKYEDFEVLGSGAFVTFTGTPYKGTIRPFQQLHPPDCIEQARETVGLGRATDSGWFRSAPQPPLEIWHHTPAWTVLGDFESATVLVSVSGTFHYIRRSIDDSYQAFVIVDETHAICCSREFPNYIFKLSLVDFHPVWSAKTENEVIQLSLIGQHRLLATLDHKGQLEAETWKVLDTVTGDCIASGTGAVVMTVGRPAITGESTLAFVCEHRGGLVGRDQDGTVVGVVRTGGHFGDLAFASIAMSDSACILVPFEQDDLYLIDFMLGRVVKALPNVHFLQDLFWVDGDALLTMDGTLQRIALSNLRPRWSTGHHVSTVAGVVMEFAVAVSDGSNGLRYTELVTLASGERVVSIEGDPLAIGERHIVVRTANDRIVGYDALMHRYFDLLSPDNLRWTYSSVGGSSDGWNTDTLSATISGSRAVVTNGMFAANYQM